MPCCRGGCRRPLWEGEWWCWPGLSPTNYFCWQPIRRCPGMLCHYQTLACLTVSWCDIALYFPGMFPGKEQNTYTISVQFSYNTQQSIWKGGWEEYPEKVSKMFTLLSFLSYFSKFFWETIIFSGSAPLGAEWPPSWFTGILQITSSEFQRAVFHYPKQAKSRVHTYPLFCGILVKLTLTAACFVILYLLSSL